MGVIVDSCIFIAAERKRLDLAAFVEVNDPQRYMSSATLSELLRGVYRAGTGERRMHREQYVRGLPERFPVVDFGVSEAESHAILVSSLEAEGHPIGAYDSIIAATALAHDWSVATLNLSEFQRVPGLKVVDASPWLVN